MTLTKTARKPSAFVLGFSLFLATFAFVSLPTVSFAQTANERLAFPRGKSGTVVRDTIRGYESVEYHVDLSAGQRLTVDLQTSNASNYYNVTAPGAAEAMFAGSSEGNRFQATVPSSGDYKITVYLMRNAARRNETARYTLSVSATGAVAAKPQPAGDYADGMSGGPDWWQVSGVSSNDTLNIRTLPSSQGRVVAQLVNGELLRNMGCRMSAGQRWCRVSTEDGIRGWAAGRFLREASR